jgi:hypothetical protein
MTEEKYQTIQIFHMGLVFQISLSWLNKLRSARTLNHLIDHRQASMVDQLFTVQRVVINTHGQMDSQQASLMNQIGQTAICHSSEDSRFITWTQAGREQFVEISYT